MHTRTVPTSRITTGNQTTTGNRTVPSDDDLVRRARQGDDDAFAQLITRHHPRLRRVAGTFVRSDADIDDLVQETCIKAHRAIGEFDGRCRITTWLGRICERTCLDHLRRRRPVPVDMASLDVTVAVPETVELVHLHDVLADLDPPLREAVVLIDVAGHSAATAARRVGVPASTMRSRVATGRRLLANELAAA